MSTRSALAVSELEATEAHGTSLPSSSEVGNSHKNSSQSFPNNFERQSADHIVPSSAPLTKEDGTPTDPNVVDWDSPNDPENPLNWPPAKKFTAICMVSILSFLSPLGSTITSPTSEDIMATFKSTNTTVGILITSIYLLGYVFGPLILAPLPELYGRSIVYNVCNLGFLIWSIACALANNISTLIIFRFLAGLFGSAPMTIGAGTIADMVPLEKRGIAMMGWVMGPVLGPSVGPLIAGYLAPAMDWRWTFWLVSVLAATAFLLSLLLLHETYAFTILQRKTKRLRKQTGNTSLRSALERRDQTPQDLFYVSITRPLKMLFLAPIVLLLSLYMALIYGYQYLMFTTFPRIYEGQYGFSKNAVGLVYLGIGVGFLVALVFSGIISDRLVIYLRKKNGGAAKPEYRLPLLFVGAVLAPVGLFLYGWSAEKELHWIVPIIGSALLGAASFTILMPALAYLVDAYTIYSASASAAAIVSRSLLGTLLPLAGHSMYDSLGVGWGTSLLGFIAVAFAPVPFVFWRFGERIRNSGLGKVDFT